MKDILIEFWLKYYIYFALITMGISCYRFVKEKKPVNKKKLIVGGVVTVAVLSAINFYIFSR